MQVAFIILALVIVAAGAFFRQQPKGTLLPTPTPTSRVMGIQTSPTATPSRPPPSPTPHPTNAPTGESPMSLSLSDLLYPSAKILSRTDTTLAMESASEAQTITDWYKDTLKTSGYSTRSFVQTKANDVVKNVLVVAGKNTQIRVSIDKPDASSLVSIVVTIHSY